MQFAVKRQKRGFSCQITESIAGFCDVTLRHLGDVSDVFPLANANKIKPEKASCYF